MIIAPDFPDHWKTRLLVELLDDEAAPVYLIRLWGHAQNRKTDRFTDLPIQAIKVICRYNGDAQRLFDALITAGFIHAEDGIVTLIGWKEYNSSLFTSWENGKKGGRPRAQKKTRGFPAGNRQASRGEPVANPNETDKRREEKRREEKDTPQTPHGVSGEKPKTDLSQLASRIATLVPEWSPHFSHIERVNLVDNLGKWEGLTESDWRALESWYADDTEASKFRAGKAKLLESPDEEVVKARRAGFSASAPKPKRKLSAPEGWQAVYAEIDPNPLHVDGEYCAPEWERLSPSEQSEVAAKMAAIGSGSTQDAHNTPSKVETADKQ